MPMLTITQKAAEKVRSFLQEQQNHGKALRVYVEGGGCAGFQVGLTFDSRRETDEVVPQGDFEVLVDPVSQMYVEGSTVDYVEGIYGAGFRITGGEARRGGEACSCRPPGGGD